MKDRRSFFKSLALIAGATSVSPMIFLPKFEPVKWKRSTQWYHFDHAGNKVMWEGTFGYKIDRIEAIRFNFDGCKWTEGVRFIWTDGSTSLHINPKLTIDSSLL